MRISDWSSDVCSSDLPQQRIAHWRTEIRRRKSHRPAIFAVPAMRQFMGQDVASARPLVPACEIFGRHAILGTAMVLQTNTPEFIAESQQKIVMIEMFGSEQCAGLRSEEQTSELKSLMRNS